MDKKSIMAIIGDLHIGGNTALATPEFEIHVRNQKETQLIKANVLQLWLWDCWQDYWNYVFDLAGGEKRQHKVIVVLLGDILEGIHNNSPQLMQEPNDQFKLAIEILTQQLDKVDESYGVVGTQTHGGLAGVNEAELYSSLGVNYDYRMTLEVDGLVHDFAHHGRAGRRPWTSSATGFVTEVMVDYAVSGRPPPNYIWRAHNHLIDDSGLKIPNTRMISIPSWQLKTDFGHRVSPATMRSDIGGFIMDGRRLDYSRARYYGQPDGITIRKV